MPFFENDGIKIHYEIEGSGPEVVIIHGFAADLQIDVGHKLPYTVSK